MSLTLSLPTNFNLTSYEHFTLYSTIDASSTPKLILRDAELIHDRQNARVFRAQLVSPSTGLQHDVICKLAYEQRSMDCVATEARFYSGKLKHLQGVYVPRYHGHFVGRTDKGAISCIVLDYAGEELDVLFLALPIDFKRALICAMIAIHDAGVRHFDIRNRNVLNNDGLPMIIDFGEAEDHECERQMGFTENVAAPGASDFGCTELFQSCVDLRIWKPGKFQYLRNSIPVRFLYNPYRLAEMAPKSWSYEDALEEAYRAIDEHLRRFYPEDYSERSKMVERRRPPQRSRSCASDETSSPAGDDGCTTDVSPSPTEVTTTSMCKA
ncbi:hypothetical protein DENSPDRAFT_839719 [Dentipellis sp. KUC8613]|nr:hypothetical protein DENSPDRAFT_839719 [Dentipellis sp. KUC8613]